MALKRITTKEGEIYFVDAKTGQRVEVNSRYTNSNSRSSNTRFNTLLSLGQFVSIFGWIAVVASVIFIIVGIDSIKTLGAIAIVSGAISLISSILVVALGQLISCFVSIEHNTYETSNYLKSMQLFQNKDIQQKI